jgi:succinate dehydrogenase/fumarate reductase flavoprotein subunit
MEAWSGEAVDLAADVLVVGGGPAAAWAAWAAASKGARVVLVDKGYMGASGAAAASGNSLLNPPPENREAVIRARYQSGQYLGDLRWMERIFDSTWRSLPLVESWGYRFPQVNGESARESLWGPEYLKVLRGALKAAGVRILDQSPAQELLVDGDGVVAGARGIQRQEGRAWTVRSKATVLAAGGAAFLSKVLGCNTNTGDALLMAAEVGGDFLGMEFSSQYAISSKLNATVTRGVPFAWATYSDADGRVLGDLGGGRISTPDLARALLKGPVFARLDKATPEVRRVIESSHFITFYPLEKAGIDPYLDRFEVTLVAEGTVRGTGGIRVVDERCATRVPGLFVAGDSASRVCLGGAGTAGGGPAAAWCIASGQWAGEGAWAFASAQAPSSLGRTVHGAGRAGLRPESGRRGVFRADEAIAAVQSEVLPLEKNLFRSGEGLGRSLARLDAVWESLRDVPESATVRDAQRSREAAAMAATARWMYASALERRESRGMHLRIDHPDLEPSQRFHLVCGGLDELWVSRETVREQLPETVGA